MFSSPAFAQSVGAASPGGGAAFLFNLAPLVLIFAIGYFLLIRPQQQRQKQHKAMIDAVKKGDVAVSGGGLIGKVTRVDETEVELEVATGVRVRIVRGTLSEVRPAGGGKPAND